MPHSVRTLQAALLLALLPLAVQAHRTWLLPNQAHHGEDKTVVVAVDAVASEDLFEYELPLPLGQLRIWGPQGQLVAPRAIHQASHRNSIDVPLEQPGSYRVSHEGSFATLRYELQGQSKGWRGDVAALAQQLQPLLAQAKGLSATQVLMRSETFLSRGKPGAVPDAPQASGLSLRALGPVTELSGGDTARFQVLMDGQPLAQAKITLIPGGGRYRYKLGEESLATDAQGRVSVRWAQPGRYWLGVAHDVPGRLMADGSTILGGGEGGIPLTLRHRYSATFEVLPR